MKIAITIPIAQYADLSILADGHPDGIDITVEGNTICASAEECAQITAAIETALEWQTRLRKAEPGC